MSENKNNPERFYDSEKAFHATLLHNQKTIVEFANGDIDPVVMDPLTTLKLPKGALQLRVLAPDDDRAVENGYGSRSKENGRVQRMFDTLTKDQPNKITRQADNGESVTFDMFDQELSMVHCKLPQAYTGTDKHIEPLEIMYAMKGKPEFIHEARYHDTDAGIETGKLGGLVLDVTKSEKSE
ncbi:MAG: hypothetical protein U5K77_00605 [Candidatus Saccharibacteria bacterium]|nr:hypothetical protein [Candidatus Saccharibacteria bacterium]